MLVPKKANGCPVSIPIQIGQLESWACSFFAWVVFGNRDIGETSGFGKQFASKDGPTRVMDRAIEDGVGQALGPFRIESQFSIGSLEAIQSADSGPQATIRTGTAKRCPTSKTSRPTPCRKGGAHLLFDRLQAPHAEPVADGPAVLYRLADRPA
jgi:hypothetical protein